MDTIEQNKLIAEFMGAKMRKNGYFYDGITFSTGWNTCRPENMKYHDSWDWLMPVVEKIHGLGWLPTLTFGGRYRSYSRAVFHNPNNRELFDREAETMIEATYKAIVQFIQWYNENKQP